MKRYFIYKHPLFGRGDKWKNPSSIRSTNTGVRWDKSPYYVWFMCLLRNKEYEHYCKTGKGDFKKIYEDFGNVFDYTNNFKDWWFEENRGVNLFAEPFFELNTEVLNPNTDKLAEDERVLYLKVPITNNPKVLRREFEQILKGKHPQLSKQKSNPVSLSKYPLHTAPKTEAYLKMLNVYDCKANNLKAKDIHIKYIKQINVKDWLNNYNEKHYNEGIAISEQEARRFVHALYSKNVYRYNKKAINLFNNAGKGIFPNTN